MPRSGVPTQPPVTRNRDLGAMVREAWGDEWLKKDVAYQFSNGRRFEVSEPNGGPYTGTATGS
jgi:anti-sigma-K factor RskA